MTTLIEKITQYINDLISFTDSDEYTYEFSISESDRTYHVVKYDNMYTIDLYSNNICSTLNIGCIKPTVAFVLGHIDHFGFYRTACSITTNWNL